MSKIIVFDENSTLYVFDTEAEMLESGLLTDPYRDFCFMSGEKYYVQLNYEDDRKEGK